MKIHIPYILFILILVSCQESKKEIASSGIKTSNLKSDTEENKGQQKLAAYCFFKMDDKYSEEKDSLTIKKWLDEKSVKIIKDSAVTSVFGQNGGGLNGSQKNPYTDLYVAVVTDSFTVNEALKIEINGQIFEQGVYHYNSNINWYSIKLDFWEKHLREIRLDDLEQMYSPDILNEINEKQLNALDILKEGQVLKFNISYKKQKVVNYFHAMYYD